MPLKAILLCSLTTSLIPASQAQAIGTTFAGRIDGVKIEVQGDSVSLKKQTLPDVQDSGLSALMNSKGIEKVKVWRDQIAIYPDQNKVPYIVKLPAFIEPTPTATGFPEIDSTAGLQMLNTTTIKLVSTVVSATPLLETSYTQYNTEVISTSEINLLKGDEKTLYATASIPMMPPSSSISQDGKSVDFEFESDDIIRIYPAGTNGHQDVAFFEKIMVQAPDNEKKQVDRNRQQAVTRSTPASDHSTASAMISPSTSGYAAVSTPMNQPEEPEASASTSEIRFVAYPEIKNRDNKKTVELIRSFLKDNPEIDQRWVVSEKVDGAHCAVVTDGNKVQLMSRSRNIDDTSQFYHSGEVLEEIKKKILKMFEEHCSEGQTLTIRGELFGGSITKKNIDYGQELRFVAFEISVDDKEIDYFKFINWASGFNILTVPTVSVVDSFEDALEVSPVFKSNLLNEGVERRPGAQENAEGVVIRLVTPGLLSNEKPAILKIKNPLFSETDHSKVDLPEGHGLSEGGKALLISLLVHATRNRLENVKSHLPAGEVNININKVKNIFINDILNEAFQGDSKEIKKIKKHREWKKIQNRLMAEFEKLQAELDKDRTMMESKTPEFKS
ncbi:hypothetical protein NX722_18785 [Endozoicomonas gorgoniicola]|uniref:RNA ligase domain-containing protein n=1 Tax=Endozoicomonas gorgoniicola TaxID=1234144 RepID=A0ABT3MZ18_9GAMM|nr:RNA ligase family protein [Endozoicomonas gorgoniicola]MCW7554627.1 hypothetical protein [Endozoicomonas gorgoniicola]